MQFRLRPTTTAQRPASAAFLRGTDAGAWLREIGRWGLPAEQLRCYLVPESIRSVRPAGLLVVVPDGAALPADVLEPFGLEAGRLYLPTHASIWPATTAEELQAALLWPRQLWHPALGLVGFEATDELPLADLLSLPPPRPSDWARAQPGHPPRPALQQLRVEAPSAAQVMQTMQQQVATEPLAALPPLAAEPKPGRPPLFENLRRGLLRAALALVSRLQQLGRGWQPGDAPSLWRPLLRFALAVAGVILGMGLLIWLITVFSSSDSGSGAGGVATMLLVALLIRGLMLVADARQARTPDPAPAARPQSGSSGGGGTRPGVLDRLGRWLGGNLAELEKKRNSEVERLLRLFEQNMDEALRYAIPLGGAYQNRGTAPASDTLGPRNTSFSLSGLGGGRSVDGWDLDAYQHDLRRQYLAAAQREVEAGRYQKAAYIHAHLLADYHAAAQVLEQGGCHREAAALYRDHLHNRPAAAGCLERGGLLLEAAELFADLKQHERAGDLYQQLGQPALAARHYERSVEHLLAADGHAEAGRLLHYKLRDAPRAQTVLLQGWAANRQPETCLQNYFDVAAAAPAADLSARVREVYQQHTPAARRVPLLRVLAQVTAAHPDATLLATARELAYEVVGAEAAAGRPAHLSLLKSFLPDDQLLGADLSRYLTARQPRLTDAAPSANVQAPQLDASIGWLHAVTHRQQWVAVGCRAGRLHLARGNWHGHVEYYSWTTAVPEDDDLMALLVADELHSTRILLRLSAPGRAFDPKLLPQNQHFPQALRVECPDYLPAWPTRVALLPDDELATLHLHDGVLLLQPYAADGRLLPSRSYPLSDAEARAEAGERSSWPCELIYRQGSFYTYYDRWLLHLRPDGSCQVQDLLLAASIYQLAASPYSASLHLAAAVDEGMVIWTPDDPDPEVGAEAYFPVDYPSVTDLQFVGPEHVVAFYLYNHPSGAGTHLYRLRPNGPELVYTLDIEPVAVLPTLDRQRFALLTQQGQLTLHSLQPE